MEFLIFNVKKNLQAIELTEKEEIPTFVGMTVKKLPC